MANLRNQQVHAGHTIRLKIDGREVGRARSITGRTSFTQEPVTEIGSIAPTEHVPTSYSGSVTLDKFKIRRRSLKDLNLASFGIGILNMDVIDIEVSDRYTGEIIEVYRGCSLTEYSSSHTAQALSGENASWVFLRADNGTEETIDLTAAADFQPRG